jgi:hypothetical protein
MTSFIRTIRLLPSKSIITIIVPGDAEIFFPHGILQHWIVPSGGAAFQLP